VEARGDAVLHTTASVGAGPSGRPKALDVHATLEEPATSGRAARRSSPSGTGQRRPRIGGAESA